MPRWIAQSQSTGALFDSQTDMVYWTDSGESAVMLERMLLEQEVYDFVLHADPAKDLPGTEWADNGLVITDRELLRWHMEEVTNQGTTAQ